MKESFKAPAILTAIASAAIPALLSLPAKTPVATTGGGTILSACAQVLMNHVGKPLIQSAARETGTQTARYLFEKVRNGGAAKVEARDYDILRQRGMSECQIRQEIEQMYGAAASQPNGFGRQEMFPGYVARSTCSATGAWGQSHPQPTRQAAANEAVQACVAFGGIPECCRNGTQSMN